MDKCNISIPKQSSRSKKKKICFISQHVNKSQTVYYITGFIQLTLKSLGLVKSLISLRQNLFDLTGKTVILLNIALI